MPILLGDEKQNKKEEEKEKEKEKNEKKPVKSWSDLSPQTTPFQSLLLSKLLYSGITLIVVILLLAGIFGALSVLKQAFFAFVR